MTLLADITGVQPTTRTFTPSSEFELPVCPIGIEVEVELGDSRQPSIDQEYWSVDGDGSLRNNGIEFISKPLFGQDIIRALDILTNALDGVGHEINARCGLHIHIDVSELTTEQLVSMCTAYALVEKSIYRYVGLDRMDNIYCLPLSQTGNIVPYLNSIKYEADKGAILNSISATSKYTGFNILPIMYQGSVEFRHHKGTADKETIMRWINIIMRIKNVGMHYDAARLAQLPYQQLRSIILHSAMEYTEEDYREGLMTAKDILNFTHLTHGWDAIRDAYGDEDRLHATLRRTYKSKKKGPALRRGGAGAYNAEYSFDTVGEL